MSKVIELLLLSALKASSKTQVRLELNPEALETYTQLAKEWKEKGVDPEFPPLVVFRDDKGDHLADGFTRRAALKTNGYDSYNCEVKEGNAMDAFLYGCKVNQEHGARLTNKDKKNILTIALDDAELVKLSNPALAAKLGLTTNFVFRHRPKSKTPGEVEAVTKSGKKHKVKTGNIGKKGGKKKAKAKKPKSEKAAKKAEESISKAVNKIATAVGGKEGEKIRTALNTGTLKLSVPEVKKWSETSANRIAKLAPLIVDLRLPVAQAIKTIDKVIGSKDKLESCVLAALAGGGVSHEKIEGEDFKYVVYDPTKFAVDISPK